LYFFWSAHDFCFVRCLFNSFVVFYLFLWCFVIFLLFFVGVDFTIFIDNCCCECGFLGGGVDIFTETSGACVFFFLWERCLVGVDVYFTVFYCF
jgi:hypothetical protein